MHDLVIAFAFLTMILLPCLVSMRSTDDAEESA